MKTSRYTEAQIIAILRQAEGGVPVAELCREHGMTPLPSHGLPANHERDAHSKQLEAPHLGLDQASSVIAAPAPPDRAAKATGGAEDFVPGLSLRRCLQPWPRVLAGRDDGAGAARRPSRACNHTLPGSGWRRGRPACHWHRPLPSHGLRANRERGR